MKSLSVYVHIPFCVRKCGYCDFLSFPASGESMRIYADALIREIGGCEDKFGADAGSYMLSTIYLGGGTPSLLDPDIISGIIEAVLKRFPNTDPAGLEISLEANPGTLTKDKLKGYRICGINRLSIGLQSADGDELKLLGRIHDPGDFFVSYDEAVNAGFDNINVDIMTAIPGQTLSSLKYTLERVINLDCSHISAYSLIIEEGTPFYDRYASGCGLPDVEEEREMYHFASDLLNENGYVRYEISNFARRGRECRHNLAYWKRDDYLGFGLGASSYAGGVRYKNTTSMKEYIKAPAADLFEERIVLDERDMMSECMFLSLRMMKGVSEEAFYKEFGKEITGVYEEETARLLRDGLIERTDGHIRLTKMGIDYGNYVFSRFV
ncbi:MAG: radical SAM family heme chaperone HemW [Lachnospiraceae bacterium]|nr:radical SAM family heme chaperone HemW [Lachnospiraceae bacterium]